jgi:hypothetical protein
MIDRLLVGLYLIGVAVALPVFYDDDDLWFLVWATLWPVLVFGTIVGTCTGSLALLIEKLVSKRDDAKKDDDEHG